LKITKAQFSFNFYLSIQQPSPNHNQFLCRYSDIFFRPWIPQFSTAYQQF